MKSRVIGLVSLVVLVIGTVVFYKYGRSVWVPKVAKVIGEKKTVADVVKKQSASVDTDLKPLFSKQNISYPPKEIALITFKDSKVMELWARDLNDFKLIRTYPVKAASGELGPKLEEGDRQVPEGIYIIEAFNPNSSYHLSMKLNYPNQFDLKWANHEGREFPGTNIFIHGKAVSIGCLAMGDKAIEELFVLSKLVGLKDIRVIISPSDPLLTPLKNKDYSRVWVDTLYVNIELALSRVRGIQ